MFTRRHFLLASIGFGLFPFYQADARRASAAKVQRGLRQLARIAWPPAISPDHVSIVDKGFACFTDEFGNLAIVDLKKANEAKVIGELNGLGKKITDFYALPHKAYVLALQESANAEAQYMLVSLSLAPASEPSTISALPLSQFSEPSLVVATDELIAVGGISTNGENVVAIFASTARRGRPVEPVLVSSFVVDLPIAKLDLQEKSLLVLGSGPSHSQLDYVSLLYPRSPQLQRPTKLEGEMTALARSKDAILIAGQISAGKCQVSLITTLPAPHAVQSVDLPGLTQVNDIAMSRYQTLVLGEQKLEQAVVPVIIGKKLELTIGDTVLLPVKPKLTGPKPKLALNDRLAYIAAGWGGAEVISFNNDIGWRHDFTFHIPHLPASGVAAWGNLAVLAAADLKVYDISHPEKPTLLKSADPGSAVKAVTGAGSFVLCLTKDILTLRKMNNISEIVAEAPISGQQLAFDTQNQKAYVLKAEAKKTTIYPIKTYSDRLEMESPFEAPTGFRRIAAGFGQLAISGLNDIALYGMGQTLEPIGTHHFDAMAIRDIALTDEYLLATAVNQDSNGFLLVLAKEGKELSVLGTVDLPHDGVALSASGQQAIAVGRSPDGKNLVTTINLKDSAEPKQVASVQAIDAASAVTIKDNLAIIVGRGLEILSLS